MAARQYSRSTQARMAARLPRPYPTVQALRRLRAGVVLAGVAFLGACASSQPRSTFDRGGSPSAVTLEVANRNFADVQVWAHRLGQRIRVGYVVANQTRTFTIPWRARVGMQVELDLSSGIWCLSDEVLVDPGEELRIEVDQNIERDPDCRRRR